MSSCASLSFFDSDRDLKFKRDYKTVAFDEQLEYLNTKISFPEIEGVPELNKRISNTVWSNLRNFKSYSKKEWYEIAKLNNRGNGKLNAFEYKVTYEISGTKDLVSVILNTYVFNGGAHGNTSLVSFTYDAKTGKYLTATQASGMTYNELSSACRKTLYKKLIDDKKDISPADEDSLRQMINTGAFPQAGNFEIFTVDGAKFFVWFEPYSVAPYSYGVQKIQVK